MRQQVNVIGHAVALLLPVLLAQGCARPDIPTNEAHTLRTDPPEELSGEMVQLRTAQGGRFRGYLTGPADATAALLMIHEWWGLNEFVKAEADRYAAAGYLVLAVDMYGGKVTTNSRIAASWMRSVQQRDANRILEAGLRHLAAPGRKVATLGWCFGGGQSLQAALQYPELVAASVVYYGPPVDDVGRLHRLEGPVLGVFGERDRWITPQRVEAFASAMAQAGRTLELHNFAAGHAFANPSSDNYDNVTAREARRVTQEFLTRQLGP